MKSSEEIEIQNKKYFAKFLSLALLLMSTVISKIKKQKHFAKFLSFALRSTSTLFGRLKKQKYFAKKKYFATVLFFTLLLVSPVFASLVVQPVTVNAAATLTFGNTSIGTQSNPISNNKDASKFQLTTPGTIQSITVYFETAKFNVKTAIYSDANGVPGLLISQSGNQYVRSEGWTTFDIPHKTLSEGDFWLAVVADSSSARGRISYSGSETAHVENQVSSHNEFTSEFGVISTSDTGSAVIYATFVPLTTPTPSPTPTLTATPISTSTPATTQTPLPTLSPVKTPSPTLASVQTQTPVPTQTPAATPSYAALPTPASLPTPTSFPTPASVAIPTPTPTPSPTQEITPITTSTPDPTPTPTATPTPIPTSVPTQTTTQSSNPAPIAVSTSTNTPSATSTPTPTPKPASTPTSTPKPTATPTPTPKPTTTPTPTPKTTQTSSSSSTNLAAIPGNWERTHGANPQIISFDYNTEHTAGNPSIRIDGPPTSGNPWRECDLFKSGGGRITVNPGDHIVFTCWVKTAHSTAGNDGKKHMGALIGIDLYGSSGRLWEVCPGTTTTFNYDSTWSWQSGYKWVPYNSDWTLLTIDFTVPTKAFTTTDNGGSVSSQQVSTIIPWVYMHNGADGGAGWFADAQLYINP